MTKQEYSNSIEMNREIIEEKYTKSIRRMEQMKSWADKLSFELFKKIEFVGMAAIHVKSDTDKATIKRMGGINPQVIDGFNRRQVVLYYDVDGYDFVLILTVETDEA